MTRLIHLSIALLVSILSITFYLWAYDHVAYKSRLVAQLEQTIQTQTEATSRMSSARNALAELNDSEAQIASYFVQEAEVVNFITDMEGQGKALGTLVRVSSVEKVETESHPTLSVSLIVTGSFDAVMRTVGAIEYAPYHLSVTKFSLTKNEENTWQANLEIYIGSVPLAATVSSSPFAYAAP